MILAAVFPLRPRRAARTGRKARAMDVFLHVGAHCCDATLLNGCLQRAAEGLRATGQGVWVPRQAGSAAFGRVVPDGRGPKGRWMDPRGTVTAALAQMAGQGLGRVLVSDARMLGRLRQNLRLAELYAGAGERLSRFAEACGGRIAGISLTLRAPDAYWAQAATLGDIPVRPARLAAARGWRAVIEEIARALPGVPLRVFPHEEFAGQPQRLCRALIGADAVPSAPRVPRQTPATAVFEAGQAAALREAYADDLIWLAGGAGGRAVLVHGSEPTLAGANPPLSNLTRGPDHEHHRRLAPTGAEGTARTRAG